MDKRASFRFFRSFYEAAMQLPEKTMQADFLLAICSYALDGIPPDSDGIVSALFQLVRPNIDASIKKSESGAAGGKQTARKKQSNSKQDVSKQQANNKQTASTLQANEQQTESKQQAEEGRRKKEEGNKEVGCITPHTPQGDFETFWQAYPKKVGKIAAKKAFERVIKTVPLETLLTAVGRQKCGAQWSKDDGQYIPNPATWLNQGRWEDEETTQSVNHIESCYTPGTIEINAVRNLQKLRDELAGGGDEDGLS